MPEEPLSKHTGHGSATVKKINPTVLKRQHEKAVADELLRSLGVEAPFERLGNDKDEPDVLYKQGARTLGIEVADAYYDNSDARQNWEHARGNRQIR